MKSGKKRLAVYLLLTFALTWAFEWGVVRPAALDTLQAQNVQLLVAACMFFPAACMLLTRLLTREGFHDLLLRPRFRGHVGLYLLAYFGPGILILLGAALYFLLFPGKLDWSAPLLRQAMADAGAPYEAQAVPMRLLLLAQLLQGLLLGGLINLIPSLGEEWGWRGYMMPRLMETMRTLPAVLAGGVIWGLWHAPLTALGHNYGLGYPGFPWAGIGAMCVFCVVLGILLTWLTVKTGSCIPAAVAHGAVNAIAAIGTLCAADGGNPFLGPAPTGIVGGAPLLIAAIPAAVWLARNAGRGEKTEQ